MASPICERIAVKVKVRLGLIDEDDGYETTVSQVVRPTRLGGFTPKDYQLIVTQGNMIYNREQSRHGNPPAIAWVIPFIIAGVIKQNESDTTAVAALKNTFAADVIKAVTSVADWHNWDQLAIDTTFGNVDDYTGSDGQAGFKIGMNVLFRVDEDDPYTARA